MTMLQQLSGFSSKIAKKAAEFQLRRVTQQAVKQFQQQGWKDEISVTTVLEKLEGIDKLQEAGFEQEWINEIIGKEIKRCT